MSEPYKNVTRLLGMVGREPAASDELLPLVYDELRALAGSFFAHQPAGHTLQPTALVHEAYVKLVRGQPIEWESRAHFMAVAARAMRQILVNHAIAKRSDKRGGDWSRVTLSDAPEPAAGPDADIEALNAAMQRLESLDERQVRIVEMRYFGGMAMQEIAHVLGLSLSAIEKDWRMARNWLQRELTA